MSNPPDGAYCYNLSRKYMSKQIGAEARGLRIKGQPKLQREPCLQNINKTQERQFKKIKSKRSLRERKREYERERGEERSTRQGKPGWCSTGTLGSKAGAHICSMELKSRPA